MNNVAPEHTWAGSWREAERAPPSEERERETDRQRERERGWKETSEDLKVSSQFNQHIKEQTERWTCYLWRSVVLSFIWCSFIRWFSHLDELFLFKSTFKSTFPTFTQTQFLFNCTSFEYFPIQTLYFHTASFNCFYPTTFIWSFKLLVTLQITSQLK